MLSTIWSRSIILSTALKNFEKLTADSSATIVAKTEKWLIKRKIARCGSHPLHNTWICSTSRGLIACLRQGVFVRITTELDAVFGSTTLVKVPKLFRITPNTVQFYSIKFIPCFWLFFPTPTCGPSRVEESESWHMKGLK
jgi:hypothetical protein